jgi:hypothetical protein
MNQFIKQHSTLLLAFTITNALFWSLFPHSVHCEFLSSLTNMIGMKDIVCPEHKVHILMGILFFGASIYIAQHDSKDL